jgi:hypothetical protein
MPDDIGAHESGENSERHSERRHEPEGIDVRRVMAGSGSLVLLLLVVCGLMYGVYWFLLRRAPESVRGSLVREAPQVTGPALDADQPSQLQALRAAEEQRLGSYGWADEGSRIARIPIDRAIEILAEKGLSAPTKKERPKP